MTSGTTKNGTGPRVRTASRSRPYVAPALATLVVMVSTLVVILTPAPAGAVPVSFTNSTTIAIPGTGDGDPFGVPASPYPSPITVSGLSGKVLDVNVTINGLNHASSADVEVMLAGPSGQTVALMTDAGGNNNAGGATFTLDDAASATIPSPIVNGGTYKPFDRERRRRRRRMARTGAGGARRSASASLQRHQSQRHLEPLRGRRRQRRPRHPHRWLDARRGDRRRVVPGSLQLSLVDFRGTEGGGVATVTIDRVNGDDGAVGHRRHGTGSATAGVDYTPVSPPSPSPTARPAAPSTCRSPTTPRRGDRRADPHRLSAPTGGATLGSPTSGRLRLQDNDARANAFPIDIPCVGSVNNIGPAGPYPSNVVVAGAGGVVTDVNLTVNGLSHTTPRTWAPTGGSQRGLDAPHVRRRQRRQPRHGHRPHLRRRGGREPACLRSHHRWHLQAHRRRPGRRRHRPLRRARTRGAVGHRPLGPRRHLAQRHLEPVRGRRRRW